MSGYCRFELLLPLRFNDGTAVPKALLAGTAIDIERHFGAASWESQVIEGIWHHGGIEYRYRLCVIAPGPWRDRSARSDWRLPDP